MVHPRKVDAQSVLSILSDDFEGDLQNLLLPTGQHLFDEIQNKKEADWQKRRSLSEQKKLEAEQKISFSPPKPS